MEHLFSLGSMVQKGKFSAGAALFVRMLKNVDFPKLKKKITCKVSEVTIWIKWSIPTLGSPTIPTFNEFWGSRSSFIRLTKALKF